jgi:hypothetical protein
MSACNPFGCYTNSRFAEFRGLLGAEIAPSAGRSVNEPGVVFMSLDEQTGNGAQQIVALAMNVWGYADSVDFVELHQASGSKAGRLLFSTSGGYLVRDSVWNGYPQPYAGPLQWEEFWDVMKNNDAYFELHPARGKPVVRGAIGLVNSTDYRPACTD